MLFDGDYLCVKEYRPKEHYHFQGMTSLKPRAFEKIQQEHLCQLHRMRMEQPKSRIVANSLQEINDKGFQYMCKFSNSKVVCTTMTDEAIAKLHEASEEHVKKLKNELNEDVHPKIKQALLACDTRDKMKELIVTTRIHIGDYNFRNQKKIRSSQMKDAAINCILYHPSTRSHQRCWLYTI